MARPHASVDATAMVASPSSPQTAVHGATSTIQADTRPFRSLSLPDELLLDVASFLYNRDLCSLSLVSKHLEAIAQDVLYHSPRMNSKPSWDGRSHIALLARTLISRPDLAQKVRNVCLTPSTCRIDFETCKYATWFRSIIGDASSTSTSFKRETLFAGDILRCVSHLQSLAVIIRRVDSHFDDYFDESNYQPDEDSISEHLFGLSCQYKNDGQPRLTLIPGLKGLEILSLGGSAIHGAWHDLPLLKQLHIDCGTSLIYPPEWSQTSQINALMIDCDTFLLHRQLSPDQSIKRLLAKCPDVVYLEVTLCNMGLGDLEEDDGQSWGHLMQQFDGDFDYLIANLGPVASTLEHLVVKECSHVMHGSMCSVSFLNCVTPITSLTHFKSLHILDVHYEALIDAQYRSVVGQLPESLELLEIHAPRINGMVPFLEEMAAHKEHFHALHTIVLYTYTCRGDTYEEFYFRVRPVWGQLAEAYIETAIEWEEGHYCEDWDDKDYDPFVCEIVGFLEGLV